MGSQTVRHDGANVLVTVSYTHTHTHKGIQFIHKKVMSFSTTWMDVDSIMLSYYDKSHRERQITFDFTHMWNIKKHTKKTKKKSTSLNNLNLTKTNTCIETAKQ